MHYLARKGRGMIEWMPLWMIAVLMMIPHFAVLYPLTGWMTQLYVAQGLLYAGLFLPGAIQRFSWRQGVVMLGLAALAFGLDAGMKGLNWPANRFWRAWLFNGLVILLVGAGEMVVRRAWRGRSVIWIVAIGVAAGAIATSAMLLAHFEQVIVKIPMGGGAQRWIELERIVHPLAMAVMTWIAVPMALRMREVSVRRRMVVGGVSVAMAGAFVIFFGSMVFVLAARSLQGRGPYKPLIGAEILAAPQSEGGYEVIWHAMQLSE
jgi:hypothetical protein